MRKMMITLTELSRVRGTLEPAPKEKAVAERFSRVWVQGVQVKFHIAQKCTKCNI
jgi:hypothetical protein